MEVILNTERKNKYMLSFGRYYGSFLYFLDRLFPSLIIFVLLHKKFIWIRLGTTDVDVIFSVFIKKEYDFPQITNPKFIIDAGAYCGYSPLYFSENYPDATIIAIEPLASNYSMLKMNCKNNKNIFLINKALWSETTTVEMCDRGTGFWGFAVTGFVEPNSEVKYLVFTTTIDEIMDMYKISKIDLLKIDIEGAEKEVFENCVNWIEKVDGIAIELHDRIKPGCTETFMQATRSYPYESNKLMTVLKTRY
jgi:FkbM family methyltransferase